MKHSPKEMRPHLAERTRLQQLFQQAPGFICVLQGAQHVFEIVNDAYYQLVGHRDVIGRSVAEVMPEVVPQGYLEKLDYVYETGEVFIGRAMPLKVQCAAGAEPERKYIDISSSRSSMPSAMSPAFSCKARTSPRPIRSRRKSPSRRRMTR